MSEKIPSAAAPLRIALVGQPNAGKSTIFNAAAGFKVATGNFPGTTVGYTETSLYKQGRLLTLIDLPGIYAISSEDLAEKVTRDYLLSEKIDLVINVIDASMLSRSLELTLQLLEMNVPLLVAMNMIDEAARKGIEINLATFTALTGLTALPVVAAVGQGVDALFAAALGFSTDHYRPHLPVYDRDVEKCLQEAVAAFPDASAQKLALDRRFIVLRLFEMDREFEDRVGALAPDLLTLVKKQRQHLAAAHDWPEERVLSSHRHALVLDLYEKIASHRHRPAMQLRDHIDRFIINPLGGMLVVGISFFLMFYLAFWLGDLIADALATPLDAMRSAIAVLDPGLPKATLAGLFDGFEAGVGIVLPYLIPLLTLLALYEDTGLLPRIAFMVDGILHRVGMHGKAIIPIILGYGCNVPAIMATRNLEREEDRRLALLIIPFITCSARTVVILGLIGKYLGAWAATLVYLGTIALTLLLSWLLSRLGVEQSSGLLTEVPPLRRPYLQIISKKVWFSLYQFLVHAWPVIVISSIALALASTIGIDRWINAAFAPLTSMILRLPESVGITLFLGIFRKELTLAMLTTALGTSDVSQLLGTQQLVTLTVFAVLYIPCLATLTTLRREGGWKLAAQSALLNLAVALGVAGIIAHL